MEGTTKGSLVNYVYIKCKFNIHLALIKGRIEEGVFGVNPPPFFGKIFNLLGFFKKKIPKPFKFSRQYEKISKTPLKIFWKHPWLIKKEKIMGHFTAQD